MNSNQLFASSSAMKVIQMSILLCLLCLDSTLGDKLDIRSLKSDGLISSNRRTSKRFSKYLSFEAPPSISSPCVKSKVDSNAEDADTTCDKECLAVRDAVRSIYQSYRSYPPVESLFDKCGMVTQGKCRYWRKISTSPSCFCYTGHDKRSFLTVCRLGIPWARKLANIRIGVNQPVKVIQNAGGRLASACSDRLKSGSPADGPRSNSVSRYISRLFRSKTAGSASIEEDEPETNEEEEEEEENELELEDWGLPETDNDQEGYMLVADLNISGQIVRAAIDTGAGNTLIDESLPGVTETLDFSRPILGVDLEPLSITRKKTVYIRTQGGFDIPVTGYVMENLRFGITLGNDFNLRYAVKIKMFESSMVIKMGRIKVKIALKWREAPKPKPILMATTTDPSVCSSNMVMYAFINRQETAISVDTGARMSFIKLGMIGDNKIDSTDTTEYVNVAGTSLKYHGVTDTELGIDNMWFKTKALVADFLMAHDYLSGNNFNKHHIYHIDFRRRKIIFKCPESGKLLNSRIYVTKFEWLFNP